MDETEELEKGSGGDDEGDDGQRKFDGGKIERTDERPSRRYRARN